MALAPAGAYYAEMQAAFHAAFPRIRLAIRSTPSSFWEKAFIVMHFPPAWPFLPTIAINYAPWHADRRSAQGVRSTTEGEIFKGTDGACADPGTQNFPFHGGGAAVSPSSFINLAFSSHTGSLVLS